jgi:hypothetical protein
VDALNRDEERYLADGMMRSAVAAVFVREPRVWDGVERLIAGKTTRQALARNLVPSEAALVVVEDVIGFLTVAYLGFQLSVYLEERGSDVVKRQEGYVKELRDLAGGPDATAELKDQATSLADEVDAIAVDLKKRPDHAREYKAETVRALARGRLICRDGVTVWDADDLEQKLREQALHPYRPHWEQRRAALDKLVCVLADRCVYPGCTSEPRREEVERIGEQEQNIRWSRRPICCAVKHEDDMARFEKNARRSVKRLLLEYHELSPVRASLAPVVPGLGRI